MKSNNEGTSSMLDGLRDVLPTEVLKMLNELLEQLQRTGHTNKGSNVINIYALGSQHIDTQVIASTCPPPKRGGNTNGREKGMEDMTPLPETMARAVEKTMAQGYWWASTAWAVVYRVYQMKGYTGGIRQFVREVEEWPLQKKPLFPCTYDGIQKPIVSGKLMRTVDKWKDDGAMEQMQKLGKALFNLLN